MDSKQAKIVFGVVLLVWLSWLAVAWVLSFHATARPLSGAASQFDASRAFKFTQEFVTSHPRRVLGSIEARQSTGYLKQQFERMGYEVSYTHFDSILAGRRQVGRNILATKPGPSRELLTVVAHYDTAGTTVQGAMDNGSGVGVLLELAWIFADAPLRHTLLFIASDGEEWGMLGALDLARNYPDRSRTLAVLSLDYVAIDELSSLRLDTVGQFSGYTPPWLRDTSRRAAQACGLSVLEPSGFGEHLERALLISATDQGPFLASGIAAINLGSNSKDSRREREIYHSPHDVTENLKVESVATYGKVAERIVRTVDEYSSVPHESMESFRLKDDLYLASASIRTLHYLTFLPFLAALSFHLINHKKYLSLGRIQREGIEFLGVALPLVLAYCSVGLFREWRLLPQYSLYPATLKDPVLENPRWGVLGGILAVGILAAAGFYFSRNALSRKLPRPDYYVSKSILMMLFLVIILVALQYNSYWAVTFLSIPAWIWGLIRIRKGAGGRAANRIWIAAAGVLYYAVTVFYAVRMQLSWKIIWYEVLAMASSMFRWQGVILAIAAFAVGIRLLVIQSWGGED